MENKPLPIPLPIAVQEQIDRFYKSYKPKEAEQLVERYKKLVLGEEYRSANLGRTEAHMVDKTRPRRRKERSKKFDKPDARKSSKNSHT